MSFAGDCREELIRIRLHEPHVRLSQLIGLTMTAGGIRLLKRPSVFYQTESLAVAKHITALATCDYDLDSLIEQKEREHRSRPIYTVLLNGMDAHSFLTDTGALSYTEEGLHILTDVPEVVLTNDETRRAFLRGCFLGGGTCVNPQRSYHLELLCRAQPVADRMVQLLTEFGFHARVTERKERFVTYLKEGDEVMEFLALIGANAAALSFESIRVEKDMRNYINRTSNCETANLDKQVVASLKQRAAIRTIQNHIPLTELPTSLREAAELRLNHPDATLAELADLAGIQKSGMNHRLTRLIRLSQELEEQG